MRGARNKFADGQMRL